MCSVQLLGVKTPPWPRVLLVSTASRARACLPSELSSDARISTGHPSVHHAAADRASETEGACEWAAFSSQRNLKTCDFKTPFLLLFLILLLSSHKEQPCQGHAPCKLHVSFMRIKGSRFRLGVRARATRHHHTLAGVCGVLGALQERHRGKDWEIYAPGTRTSDAKQVIHILFAPQGNGRMARGDSTAGKGHSGRPTGPESRWSSVHS